MFQRRFRRLWRILWPPTTRGHKTYYIGGKTYEQRPLVLGQVKQLLAVTEGVAIPRMIDLSGNIAVNMVELVYLMGDRLPEAMAVVLTEQGTAPRDKDLQALAGELRWAVLPDQALDIVSDFFVGNPLSSFLEKLAGLTGKLNTALPLTG